MKRSSLLLVPPTNTSFLESFLKGLFLQDSYLLSSSELIRALSEKEPLFAESLQTPQDMRYHAEGPFLFSHVQNMLIAVMAFGSGDHSLLEIEEFHREKHDHDVFDELDEVFKKHRSFFEAFALLHDVSKWACMTCSSSPNSLGEKAGFVGGLTYDLEMDHRFRQDMKKKYLELFHEFSEEHPQESSKSLQATFYHTYQIDVHYPHHDTLIFAPVYQELLNRVVAAYGFSGEERNMLEDVIAQHMRFGKDFDQINPSAMQSYFVFAKKRGYDEVLFVRLAQGCLFFDMVCGSARLTKNETISFASHQLLNAIRSEHRLQPELREQRLRIRTEEKKREQNRLFQEAGLDGVSLLDVLQMEPGPVFGQLLRKLQHAILGDGEMPLLPEEAREEIDRRVTKFYQYLFKQGI